LAKLYCLMAYSPRSGVAIGSTPGAGSITVIKIGRIFFSASFT